MYSSSPCLCDEKQDLLDELSLLRDVFIANGYPERLVKETLEKSWEVETLKAVLVGIEQEVKPVQQKDYFDVLHAPYVKGFSELANEIKEFPDWVCTKERRNSLHKAMQAKAKSGAQELEKCCLCIRM